MNEKEKLIEAYKKMCEILPYIVNAVIEAMPRVIEKIRSGEFDETIAKIIIETVVNDDE